jgi:hypothetical protein
VGEEFDKKPTAARNARTHEKRRTARFLCCRARPGLFTPTTTVCSSAAPDIHMFYFDIAILRIKKIITLK